MSYFNLSTCKEQSNGLSCEWHQCNHEEHLTLWLGQARDLDRTIVSLILSTSQDAIFLPAKSAVVRVTMSAKVLGTFFFPVLTEQLWSCLATTQHFYPSERQPDLPTSLGFSQRSTGHSFLLSFCFLSLSSALPSIFILLHTVTYSL